MSSPAPIAWAGWTALAEHPYAYPLLEALHIAGIALLVGNLVLLELRVWGRAPEIPVPALARLALGLSLAGFGLVALTGLVMFSAAPGELLANRAFVVKMALIALAGCNAAFFHARGSLELLDGTARALTVLSTGLWLAVIIAGRWIAYA